MIRFSEYREIMFGQFRDGLPEVRFFDQGIFSALGARLCYSSGSIFDLVRDPRVIDPEKRLHFLTGMARHGHFSVFAMSPGVVEDRRFRRLYKAWSVDGELFLCNLRHLIEINDHLGMVNPEDLLMGVLKAPDAPFVGVFLVGISFDEEPEIIVSSYASLRESIIMLGNFDRPIYHPAYMVTFFIPDIAEFGWMFSIVFGLSRAYSHQHVRHTWQNFLQRSHRYTEVDSFIFPFLSGEEITSGTPEIRDLLDHASNVYQGLLNAGYKKGDARYVMPVAATTSLAFAGPLFVMEHFVRVRSVPTAQREIKSVAKALGLVISSIDKRF